MSEPIHVAVLMGGWSNERPVSLMSGNGVADSSNCSSVPSAAFQRRTAPSQDAVRNAPPPPSKERWARTTAPTLEPVAAFERDVEDHDEQDVFRPSYRAHVAPAGEIDPNTPMIVLSAHADELAVDPATSEIRIEFDQDMSPRSRSIRRLSPQTAEGTVIVLPGSALRGGRDDCAYPAALMRTSNRLRRRWNLPPLQSGADIPGHER